MKPSLSRHIERSMSKAGVSSDPFPHAVIDDFLPEALFDELKRNYPSDEDFALGRKTSKGRRDLDSDSPNYEAFLAAHPACAELASWIRSGEGCQILVAQFRAHLARHGAVLRDTDRTKGQLDISRAGDGYVSNCHISRRDHIISGVLFMNEAFGGSGGELLLYTHRQIRVGQTFESFPREEDVEVAKRLTPRARQAVVFLNTPNSYHGVSPLLAPSEPQCFLHFAVDNLSNPQMWPAVTVDEEMRQKFLAQ
jgi:hypothetical protein